MTQSSYSQGSPLNTLYTINNGMENDALDTGKLLKVNNLDYPNVSMKVFTGESAYAYLPYKCSDIDLSEEGQDIYTWTQNKPSSTNMDTEAKTLSLLNN